MVVGFNFLTRWWQRSVNKSHNQTTLTSPIQPFNQRQCQEALLENYQNAKERSPPGQKSDRLPAKASRFRKKILPKPEIETSGSCDRVEDDQVVELLRRRLKLVEGAARDSVEKKLVWNSVEAGKASNCNCVPMQAVGQRP